MTFLPLIILAICFALGMPVAYAMICCVIPYFIADPYMSANIIIQRMVANTESTSMMAAPFFIIAGAIMNYSGISKRIYDFAGALVGHLVGGLGHVNVIVSAMMGGISGYLGGWIDNIIMRIVDVFYCIPSMPVIIIIGAAMDAMRVDSWKRMMYLMLILGFLGWPSIARLVRGQILSPREQEFMLATEACGIKVWHRIFRHLIPNVIPQLIVTCTMGLGSTILTEATLSFLGLGVKYPFASWGNIINDVNNAYVMTNYLFIWIPAGICLLLTVLGFNFVGDGLRDAFDPKMKR